MLGRIGGLLIISGSALYVIVGAIVAGGGSAGIGGSGAGSVIAAVGLAALGSGVALVALGGVAPFDTGAAKAGLWLLAVGLVGTLVSAILSAGYPSDPLQSWPIVVSLFIGLAGLIVGLTWTGLALLRAAGPARLAGVLILVGAALVVVTTMWTTSLPDGSRTVAVGVLLLGGFAVGGLAVMGDRAGRSTNA